MGRGRRRGGGRRGTTRGKEEKEEGDRSRDRERERNRKHVRQRGRGELYTDRRREMKVSMGKRWREERGSEYIQSCMGCTRRDVKILQTGS